MPSHNYSASIPPNVYRDTTLKITEIRVYCEIEAAGNGKKDMWAKTAVIADTLGISYIATRRAITSLEQKGYIYRWWEGSIRHIRVVLNETRVVLNETRGVVLNETRQTSPKQGPHEDYKEKTIKEVIKKRQFGEYKHIRLTDSQHSKLVTDWGEAETARMIRILDEGIQLKGYKYKDFNLALRQWKRREAGAAATPRNKAGPEYCHIHTTMRLDNGKCRICEEEGKL